MGMKIVVNKWKPFSDSWSSCLPVGHIHGIETINDGDFTICGIPIVDEVESSMAVTDPVDCPECIATLENRGKFKKIDGKWR